MFRKSFQVSPLTPLALAAGVVMAMPGQSDAATISQWTFESATATANNVAVSPTYSPETGTGSLFGVHTNAGSGWSLPEGNGSLRSFQGTRWETGSSAALMDENGNYRNYFQFSTDASNYEGIQVSFDHGSQPTGPRDFVFQYSTDNVTYTTFASYSAPSAAQSGAALPWETGAGVQDRFHFSFDLSSITSLNNDSSIYFRLSQSSLIAVNNGVIGGGAYSRLDNVTISGTPVPEPASLGLTAMLGTLFLRRRR